MLTLKGFHFQMSMGGYTSSGIPVQSATGDADLPNLRATANLQEGGLLIEIDVIYASGGTYLKSFTGGWQRLTGQQLAQFFDPSALFDPHAGLFAVMRETQSPARGNVETIDGHDTYPVRGSLAGARLHQLLNLIRGEGSDQVTYWIESDNGNLWRTRLTGKLFNPAETSTVTFDFSNHDQAVSVTPPALG
jgi:lipoprotein LprG